MNYNYTHELIDDFEDGEISQTFSTSLDFHNEEESSASLSEYSHELQEQDEEDDFFTPQFAYRDAALSFVPRLDTMFTNETMDTFYQPTTLKQETNKLTFVQGTNKISSNMVSKSMDEATPVPIRPEETLFLRVNPSFTSRHMPEHIMEVLKTQLKALNCQVKMNMAWELEVQCDIVAEIIQFQVTLEQFQHDSKRYEINFYHKNGDESEYLEFTTIIRKKCQEIDEEGALLALLPSSTSMPSWDNENELVGRKFALDESAATEVLEDVVIESSTMQPETLFDIARSFKNHCRHKGNRKLFLRLDREKFLTGLRSMLAQDDDMARLALFVLLQYAKDHALEDSDYNGSFFQTPYEKSSFEILIDNLVDTQSPFTTSCGMDNSIRQMVSAVRQSVLFA